LWGNYEYNIFKFLNDTILPGTPLTAPLQTNDTSKEERQSTYIYDDQYDTGVENISNICQFVKFNGKKSLGIWGSDKANEVSGADGTMFRPFINDDEPLAVFLDTLFRRVTISYAGDDYVRGIRMKRYILDKKNIVNSSVDPDYYLNAPAGLLNLTKALNDTPIFVSKPFFLDADPYYASMVDFTNGKANSTLHETFIDVEPITGITFNAMKRVQINTLVKNSLIMYPKINTTIFPVFWFQIYGSISESQAEDFKSSLVFALDLAYWVGIGGVIGGITFGVIGIALFILSFMCRRPSYLDLDYESIN